MMIFKRLPNILIASVLALSLFVSGCGAPTTTTPSAPPTSAGSGQTVATNPLAGGEFNKFFPRSQGNYNITYRQEKSGLAQAQLAQGNTSLALLSINDLAGNPAAVTKFRESSRNIGGYPAVTQGRNATAVLVADRFQVKIISQSDSFSESDREQWLTRFDLTGLARLR